MNVSHNYIVQRCGFCCKIGNRLFYGDKQWGRDTVKESLRTAPVRLIFRRSAGRRRFGPIFLHYRISRGDSRYTGLQALSPALWQAAAGGIGIDLANLARSLTVGAA